MDVERTALEEIAALLDERVGLKIGPDGLPGLRLALTARLGALPGTSAHAYVRLLKGVRGDVELRALLPFVTVGKTDFFRDDRQFAALEQTVLPQLLSRARREGRQARIWSAGCATGEEPYSLSILLSELGASDYEVEISATDLNPAAVERARMGEFPSRKMSGLSSARVTRFFDSGESGGFRVKPTIARRIRFSPHNLADADWGGLGAPGAFDLILCRNVIIYFGVETIRRVMDRFHDALRPDGYLFLGYSESLFKVYERFRMVEVGPAFVYRHQEAPTAPPAARLAASIAARPARTTTGELPALKPQGLERTAPRATTGELPVARIPSGDPGAVRPPPGDVGLRTPTVELPAIRLPSGALTPPFEAARPTLTPAERMGQISQEIDRGGFDTARERLARWLEQDPDQLPALLTLGNLHGLTGDPEAARVCFEKVLSREPLCVDAHVFRAVAAFQVGALGEARVELTRALFLEPSLALAHYLLAQIEERMGQLVSARRSYRNALAELRTVQRPLAGYYPDLPEADAIGRAARYALSAIEDRAGV